MCGRFVATTAPQQLALLFDAVLDDSLADRFEPNFNVAPTTQILHLVDSSMTRSDEATPTESRHDANHERSLRRAHWGLLPSWSKDRRRAASMINARSETLTEKPSFRPLLRAHRCVVPVDGYYEWRTVGVDVNVRQPKQPYFIRSVERRPLSIAGLWSTWNDPERGGQTIRRCAMITTSPNPRLAAIHDRMPCILHDEDVGEWLSATVPPLHLLRSAPEECLEAVTVSTAVNNVRNKGPELIEPTITTLF